MIIYKYKDLQSKKEPAGRQCPGVLILFCSFFLFYSFLKIQFPGLKKIWLLIFILYFHSFLALLKSRSLKMKVSQVMEKEMAPHSRIPAWRIPWTEEPGRLLSMGSQRVRHS